MPTRRCSTAFTVASLLALGAVGSAPAFANPLHDPASSPPPVSPRVVADELNNPRQLNFADDGSLIVAEAGSGGENCASPEGPPPAEGEEGAEPPPCVGPTGGVTTIENPGHAEPTVTRVIEGLPSMSSPNGAFALGTNGADDLPGSDGDAFVVAQSPGITDGAPGSPHEDNNQGVYFVADPTMAPPPEEGEELPDLTELVGGDLALQAVNLYKVEQRLNPDTAQIDSNPYAILVVPGNPDDDNDDYALVADAGANTVWKLTPNHEATNPEDFLTVSVFVTYPTTEEKEGEQGPPEFVPTSLAMDRWGHFFVGGLGSEVKGAASVVKYDANGKELRRWTGFTGITGVAVDDDNIYVSQIFGSTPPAPPGPGGPESEAPPAPTSAPGSIVKTSRHETDAMRYEVDVPFPGGMVPDNMGGVYVSAYSTSPAEGVEDAFGPDSFDLEGGQVWQVGFSGAREVEAPGAGDDGPIKVDPIVTKPDVPDDAGFPDENGDGRPDGTNGQFRPVGEEYYAIEFTTDTCGQDVTVTAGDVRDVEERITYYPGGLKKTEVRGNATVDITRADGVMLDEVDVSGPGVIIESEPDANGIVHVTATLEGASIAIPADDKQEAALAAANLPKIALWLAGDITFEDKLQLSDDDETPPTTLEAKVVRNTAVGVLDVCALLDAESSKTPVSVPTQPAPPATPITAPAPPSTTPAARAYENCTELNAVYPNGVKRDAAATDVVSGSTTPVTTAVVNAEVYAMNSVTPNDLDRDNDGIACEQL